MRETQEQDLANKFLRSDVVELGSEVTLSNILIGNIESVLLEVGFSRWPDLLAYAISQVYRIHSRDPETELSELIENLKQVIPEIGRKVAARETRYDAADQVLRELQSEQRIILRDAYGV